MYYLEFFALKHGWRSIYIPLLATFLFALPLCGQEVNNVSLRHTHYSIEDGLPNQLTYRTFQDSKGFIWIMTNYGFSRFDGKTFINYSPENLGVEFGSITDVHEDANGNLWLFELAPSLTARNKGLFIFNPAAQQIKPYQGAAIQSYHSLGSTPEKTIIIGTEKGELFLCDDQKQELVYSFADERAINEIITTDNYYWLNSGKKLSLLKRNGEFVQEWNTSYRFDLLGKKGENIYVRDVFFSASAELNDRIMLYQANEISPQVAAVDRLNDTTKIEKKWKYFEAEEKFIVDNETEGLFLLAETGKNHFSIDSLIGDKIAFGVEDSYFCFNGYLWISSMSGVYKIQITNSKFTSYLNKKEKPYSMRSIVVTGDSLYCNTYAGNIIYDLKKKEIVRDLSESNINTGLSGIQAKNGCIYLGGMGSVLQQICENGKQEDVFYYASNQSISDKNKPREFWAILESSDNKIWLGTNRGLSFFNEEKEILERFKKYNQFTELSETLVFDIIETKDAYWIASQRGLFKLESQQGITSWFHSGEPTPNSGYLPANSIIDIHEDEAGILWLTTQGSGLIRFNPQDGSYKQITVEEGLAHNVTNDILEDDSDNLWISTNNGIVRLNRKSGDLETFDKSDGIHMNEFNKKSSAKLEDGRFVFGGLDGFVAFHPKDFFKTEDKEKRSPLRITQVIIGDSLKYALDIKEPIFLTNTRADILVNLHLLEFFNNKPAVYEWKWKDEDDTEFKQLPSFQFHISEVPYGESTVIFRARSAKGVPALNVLELSFSTPSLFSLTQILIGTGLILGLYFLFFREEKIKKKKNASKDKSVTLIIKDKKTTAEVIDVVGEIVEKEEDLISKKKVLILSLTDKKWIDELRVVIQQSPNIGQLSVENMATKVNLSSRQLSRKIKQLTGITPNQFLRDIKLEKAKMLLETGAVATVAEVSFAVGFEKPDYFSRLFQEKYGVRPVRYFDKKKEE